MRSRSVTRIWLNGRYTDTNPPPVLHIYSEVREQRDEFSPKKINLPKEAMHSFVFVFLIDFYISKCQYIQYVHIYK